MSGTNTKDERYVDRFAQMLSARIEKEVFTRKYAPAKDVLKLVGAGVFLAASVAAPNLPLALKPFLRRNDPSRTWKRFNIPYLKQTIDRLERQKLVEFYKEQGVQAVRMTKKGQQKVQTMALVSFCPQKPHSWDHRFRLVSFDLPEHLAGKRKHLVSYLKLWRFYPLQKSVYLHAYPCREEIETVCNHLGIRQYVQLFTITDIDHEQRYKDFFDVS